MKQVEAVSLVWARWGLLDTWRLGVYAMDFFDRTSGFIPSYL